MTLTRLLWKNLTYHWRGNLAVLLGVAVGTAVLTGALLVGDSLRGSLRALALKQLGWVEEALVAPRFFREDLGRDLPAERIAPAIFLQGSVALGADPARVQDDDDSDEEEARPKLRRLGKVTILGVDDRFWLKSQEIGAEGQVLVNRTLAQSLGARAGDTITLYVQKAENIPRESLIGKRKPRDVIQRRVVKVRGEVSESGLGNFTLKPSPEPPRNVFVPLSWLQKQLNLAGKVNALLAGGARAALQDPLAKRLTLDDWNLHLRTPADRARSLVKYLTPPKRPVQDRLLFAHWNGRVPPELGRMAGKDKVLTLAAIEEFYRRHRGYLSLESDQMYLEPAVVDTVQFLIFKRRVHRGEQPELHFAITLVHLADTIHDGVRKFPYAVVAALDARAAAPLGPFQSPDSPPLGPNEIILAERTPLGASLACLSLGSPWALAGTYPFWEGKVTLEYFLPDAQGQLEKHQAAFRLRETIPLRDAADDPFLTPEFPGITDKLDFANWDPRTLPFPFDRQRVKAADDQFWKRYRTTPRAYITLQRGQELWKNRFGAVTSIRLAPKDSGDLDRAEKILREGIQATLRPEEGGFVFDPVRRRALQAGAGSADFGMLFLGFSVFLIVAALLLVGLLFRLNLDRRAGEIGVLLATGYRPRTVRCLLLAEGWLLAGAGGLVGLLGALGYAALLLDFLSARWPEEQRLTFLQLHASPLSFAIGYLASLVVSGLTIRWALRVLSRVPAKDLLAGVTQSMESGEWKGVSGGGSAPRPNSTSGLRRDARHWPAWSVRIAVAGGLGALACLALGLVAPGHAAQAMSFFGSGAFLLIGCLAGVGAWLRRQGKVSLVLGAGALTRLGQRNAARHPVRSLLTVGLLASATFLVVAVESFHKEAGRDFFDRSGGSGGFRLLAETDVPLFQDLNDSQVRDRLKLQALKDASVFALRVRAGDDASCLNLYQPLRPRLLGLPPAFVERGGFSFAATLAQTDQEKANPWLLLEQPPTEGAVPVFVDANTAKWILKVGLNETLEVPDEKGEKRKLRVVGLLQESIFQSELLLAQSHFQALFPRQEGFQFFLVDCPADKVDDVKNTLETGLGDHGMVVTGSQTRLAAYLEVENTYLRTFQALGGFGLLLGALGLAVVLVRSVWERRGELALLRALGFRNRRLGWLVLAENGYLLALGLGVGTAAALVAVAPHLAGGILWLRLAILLAGVLFVGLAAATLAVAFTVRAPLLTALRRE